MSRTAILYPKTDRCRGDVLGVFMLNDGSPKWVLSMLKYLRMIGCPSPSGSGVGMARLIQVVSNFEKDERFGVMIGHLHDMPLVCYPYEIEGWGFSKECMEQYEPILKNENLERFIRVIDRMQPLNMQIGEGMIHVLYDRDETLNDLSIDYHQELRERKSERIEGKPFVESRRYETYGRGVRIIEKKDTAMTVDYDGSIQEVPLYKWIDGSESTVVIDCEEMKKHLILSVPKADVSILKLIEGFHDARKFESSEDEECNKNDAMDDD